MRCLRAMLAVVTMLAVMATSATPTTARQDNDGRWDNCWWDLELVVGLVRRLRLEDDWSGNNWWNHAR